ncbi:MAG: T9SS type A sorting domain-containing protein [Bacteroidia bacterium]|nr:T9SS type A sorting domain-containing protein [Bacteroidia bacterium]
MTKVLSFLSLLFLATLLNPVFSQCGVFYDGFESGSYTPTWSTAGGTYTTSVITTNPAVGTYCLQQSGNGGHLSGIVATFPVSQPTSLKWRAKIDPTTSSGGYMVCGNSSTTTSNCIAFVYFSGGTDIRFFNGTGINTPCTASTWYELEMRNIDYVNRRFDIYINNALIQANYGFRSTNMSDMDRIYLYNISSMTAYYDEILVGGSAVSLTATVTNPLCAGDSTGSVSIVPGGGTPQYTYSWTTGGTSSAISNLGPGSYGVTVTDSNGCIGQATYQITSPTPLSASFLLQEPVCPGDSNGSIDLSPSGGTPSYTYQWSNGATTEDISNLPSGNYSLTLTDTAGCSHLDSVQLSGPQAFNLNFAGTQPTCNGTMDGSIDLTVTGGTPGYTYQWSTGDTTEDINNLDSQTYSLSLTDSAGCTYQDSVFLNQPDVLDPVPVGVNPLCHGDSTGEIQLTVNGGTPAYTYQWSNGDMTMNIQNLSSGSYQVVVTDNNGCSAMASVTLTDPAALAASGVVTDEVTPPGNNGAIDLTVTGGTPGYTYLWNNSATTEDLSGLASGSYSVTITDQNGCTFTEAFVVSSLVGQIGELEGFDLRAFPNPGNGAYWLLIEEPAAVDAHLILSDLQGRILRQQSLNLAAGQHKIQLDLTSEANGIYLLHLQQGGRSYSLKLVKE